MLAVVGREVVVGVHLDDFPAETFTELSARRLLALNAEEVSPRGLG